MNRKFFCIASFGCSLIALLALFLGAYLFDHGLVGNKNDIFLTAAIPMLLSVGALIAGAHAND